MFSICIPNYNYEKYLASTLDSIFDQTNNDFEVAVADNNSTDNSLQIIRQYSERYPGKIKFKVNPVNLGFAPNLDQAASLASANHLIMLSSDDRMSPEALAMYKKALNAIGNERRIIICSANDVINAQGEILSRPRAKDFRFRVWRSEDVDHSLTAHMGVTVYRVEPIEMLRRAILHCTNPFNFCATCYSKELYEVVGGYGGGRMINPDKWFHWRIIAKADEIVFIDAPLFQYRWHAANQTAQQAGSGFLKYMVDEYRNVIEMPDEILMKVDITRNQFIHSFITLDIFRHGMGEFSKGRWLKSLRIFLFGWSTFPSRMIRHPYLLVYILLLLTSPAGAFIVSKLRSK